MTLTSLLCAPRVQTLGDEIEPVSPSPRQLSPRAAKWIILLFLLVPPLLIALSIGQALLLGAAARKVLER